MLLSIIYFIAATGAALYLLNLLYGWVSRQKARNTGFFRDDRRDNDWR